MKKKAKIAFGKLDLLRNDQLNNKNKIVNLEKVPVLERVRDLSFKTGALYLFLEDTASIGIIKLN